MNSKADVIIVGSGVAGLFCALNLPERCRVVILTKDRLERSDSYLAQGGICVAQGESDYESFYEDTMRAGHYQNDPAAVSLMIESSRSVIEDLVGLGADFARQGGNLLCTREGGHSRPRIVYHQDITGREVMTRLIARVKERSNIEIHEYETMVDLLVEQAECRGVISRGTDGRLRLWQADSTVLACGGVGGLFEFSTNYRHITGDAIAIALEHGIATERVDAVQMHPTTFYDPSSSRCLLISESVRGEGAHLLNERGERFTDELAPRDVVTAAIRAEMERAGTDHVYLAMQHLGEEMIRSHFPNIYESCRQRGIDVLTQPIPVVPAQHYLMGGIKVDLDSQTSMARLYAIGETSCNGVHGANRLASNSLLESLVFARRAARRIGASHRTQIEKRGSGSLALPDFEKYQEDSLMERYHRTVREKMGEQLHAI